MPTAGVNVLGSASIGEAAAGAVVIKGKALDPATGGIGPTGTGLSPALLVSTEPNVIPAAIDIADDDAVPPVELVSQVPDGGMLPGNGIPIVIPPPS